MGTHSHQLLAIVTYLTFAMFRFGLLVLCLVSAAAAKPADAPVDQLAQNEFAAYDTDGDGIISKSELKACFSTEESSVYDTDVEGDWDLELGLLDSDKDGFICDSELDNNMGAIMSAGVGMLFQDVDSDGDGNIDLGEVYPSDSELGYMDSNSDGVLDAGEQQAMLDAIKSASHYVPDNEIKDLMQDQGLVNASGCVAISSLDSQTKKAILEYAADVYVDIADQDQDGGISLSEGNNGAIIMESAL